MPSALAAQDAANAAEASLIRSDEAGANSTSFVLLAVVFALSLFFLSIATKFSAPKVQVWLIVAGALLPVYGVGRMTMLPHSF